MSGPKNLNNTVKQENIIKQKNVIEQMDEIVNVLNQYEQTNGLPKLQAPGTEDELQTYLSMNRDKLEKLNVEEYGSIAYRLAQYSFYLQRLHNQEQARFTWAQTQLNHGVAQHINDYDKYMKYANKVALMAREYQHIKKLYQIVSYAKQRMQRLSFLSSSISNLRQTLLSIQKAKLAVLQTH